MLVEEEEETRHAEAFVLLQTRWHHRPALHRASPPEGAAVRPALNIRQESRERPELQMLGSITHGASHQIVVFYGLFLHFQNKQKKTHSHLIVLPFPPIEACVITLVRLLIVCSSASRQRSPG